MLLIVSSVYGPHSRVAIATTKKPRKIVFHEPGTEPKCQFNFHNQTRY